MRYSGLIIDALNRRQFHGEITVEDGRIASIAETPAEPGAACILPGFVDAHVHIESSMLTPYEFARLATPHGTVAAVSDPHEIANVCGLAGVRFMMDNGARAPFHFAFGAPSCVPATPFESAGAAIDAQELRELFQDPRIHYLSEVMNFPGVLHNDPIMMEKIRIAKKFGRVVDGHAPGLAGGDMRTYIQAGISTDHECFTLEEALEKIGAGMHIIVREGSAARNFEALHSLFSLHPGRSMMGSDDKHPDDLAAGHINALVKRAIAKGHAPLDVLQAACVNPVVHYGLDVGLLRAGDPADFIIIDNQNDWNVLQTYVRGRLVAERGRPLFESIETASLNQFCIDEIDATAFQLLSQSPSVRAIGAIDGQLITSEIFAHAKLINGYLEADTEADILKIAVISRYKKQPAAIAFIHGFGLKQGAIASSVAHDSHNIVAVGTSDNDLCAAVNAIIREKGGISLSHGGKTDVLPLPIAGLMSRADGYEIAKQYRRLDEAAKHLGSTLSAPYMTLSFMALLVIPALKLSDRGLFDGNTFQFVSPLGK